MAKKKSATKKKKTKKKSVTKKTAKKATKKGGAKKFFAHPKALVDSKRVGDGTRVWAFSHILDGAVVGSHCNICESVFVENGVEIGDHVTVKNGVQLWTGVTCEDYVFIGPNATFTNDVHPRVAHPLDPADFARTHVCFGASIGANATIVAGITIGAQSLIGAGTVVIQDVPSHALVVGNPARQVGWVCSCGTKLDNTQACPRCRKAFEATPRGLVPRD